MKKFLFLLVVSIFVGTSLISCDSDNDDTSEIQNLLPLEAETFLEVSYGTHSEQVYDLYLPANRSNTKTKVIILVHGGGWSGGDKEDMDGFVTLVQENHPDHAVVNVNYVLATATTKAFPNQFLQHSLPTSIPLGKAVVLRWCYHMILWNCVATSERHAHQL